MIKEVLQFSKSKLIQHGAYFDKHVTNIYSLPKEASMNMENYFFNLNISPFTPDLIITPYYTDGTIEELLVPFLEKYEIEYEITEKNI
jgi:hypothetical protein